MTTADFWTNISSPLLVGEGNFSFSKSLAKLNLGRKGPVVASVPDLADKFDLEQQRNAESIRLSGGLVFSGVDATKLENYFKNVLFNAVIFNFPCNGSRQAKWNTTSDHVLVRKFLRSAKSVLKKGAVVGVTTVDSSHYDGRFRLDDAACWAGMDKIQEIEFKPESFPEYKHVNTNDDKSALEHETSFKTTIFCATK